MARKKKTPAKMARKKKTPAKPEPSPPVEAESLPEVAEPFAGEQNDGITQPMDPFTQSLLDKLCAAEELIHAQAELIECIRLRRPTNVAQNRVTDARKRWEELNIL